LRAGVTVETAPGCGRLRVPAWGIEIDASNPTPKTPLERAYLSLRGALGVGAESPVDLFVHFGVPTGAGLGSSGAMAIAVARALCRAHGLREEPEPLLAAAMASETEIHGRPSGLDHTVALRGGFGLFTRAAGLQPVKAARPVVLAVGNTGRERDTRGRVERIAQLVDQRGDEVHRRFSAIAQLVERGRQAVVRGDVDELGQAMDENQTHLAALEVSCEEIERMCEIARGAGAAGAKLTGGGGGGCVIAVAPGREAEVVGAWERAGFRGFVTTVGGEA
jgi:mevalonate kinase